ncbi:MAG: LptF/LptG family permease [Candidatus Neomarinimicrobiota bacterium]
MKKIDYYILREFSTTFLIVSLFFTLISLIVDIFENLDHFIDNEVSMDILFNYYKASLPSMISVTIPVSCLVSSVFTYGMMIQKKEWLVFKSSGLSLYRLSSPVLLLGLILSIGSFYFDNTIVIENNKKKNELKNNYMSKNRVKDKSVFENVYFQMNEKDLIAVEKFNSNNNVAVNLNFIEIDNGVLLRRIDSKKAIWEETNSAWNLKDFSIREFEENGLEKNVIVSKNDSLIALKFEPNDIIKTASKSEEISYKELKNQIISLENNGVNTLRWKVDLNYKIAYSFISIIVIFCGIPLSVYRSNTSLAFGGGLSLATIFSYVILLKFGQSLAYGGLISPFLGTWMSNIIFISVGIYLMINARK